MGVRGVRGLHREGYSRKIDLIQDWNASEKAFASASGLSGSWQCPAQQGRGDYNMETNINK